MFGDEKGGGGGGGGDFFGHFYAAGDHTGRQAGGQTDEHTPVKKISGTPNGRWAD